MTQPDEERFLQAALAEGGQPVSAGGPPLRVVLGPAHGAGPGTVGLSRGAQAEAPPPRLGASGQAALDLDSLSRELALLRRALRERVDTAEETVALGEVASAELSAAGSDGPSTLRHLKVAGTLALETAREIGALVAAQAIEECLNF